MLYYQEAEQVQVTIPGFRTGGSAQTITMSPTASTIFVVSGTDSVNCTSSASQPVVVNLPPSLSVSANKTLTCENGQVILYRFRSRKL